ncbi:hypothetical protein G6F60_014497 [Rhizopus arrhizus]|nr:hypothetical protein G6F60_014497 [Rhizopus arrhizus]
MNLSAVDLNLLVAFEALYETRNVTLAGQRIHRAQPSVSSALNRLRPHRPRYGADARHQQRVGPDPPRPGARRGLRPGRCRRPALYPGCQRLRRRRVGAAHRCPAAARSARGRSPRGPAGPRHQL